MLASKPVKPMLAWKDVRVHDDAHFWSKRAQQEDIVRDQPNCLKQNFAKECYCASAMISILKFRTQSLQ